MPAARSLQSLQDHSGAHRGNAQCGVERDQGRNLAIAEAGAGPSSVRAAIAANEDPAPHEHKIAELEARAKAVQRGGTLSVNEFIGALRTLLKFAQGRGYAAPNVAGFVNRDYGQLGSLRAVVLRAVGTVSR